MVIAAVGAESIELNPLYTGLVAGNIFLLAGTLADYKESEKLPVELAASLDSISDELRIVEQATAAPEARAALGHVADTVRSILQWLYGNEPFDAVLDRIERLNHHFRAVEPLTQATYVNRIKTEQNAARRMLLRIYSIHETSFVVAGFLVAELTSTLLITVLLFIDVGALGTDLIVLCTLTFLLGYVLLLIPDLDDPFEYSPEVKLRLRDGSTVVVRPIRPDDRDAVEQAFSRLSERSRYQRFLTAVNQLSAADLRYLTEVDHHDHEALVAFDADRRRDRGRALRAPRRRHQRRGRCDRDRRVAGSRSRQSDVQLARRARP